MVYFGGFFPKLESSRSFLYILLTVRISEAAMCGEHYVFRVPNSLQGCDGWGEGRGILYIKVSLVPWKDISLWQTEFGPEKKENHFVSGNFAGVFSVYFVGRISEAAMGRPRSSFRARRSSVGGLQRSSVGCRVAENGASYPEGAA